MSLDDAIGSGPDFTADSVLDRVSRSILPDLPQYANADMVLNRLNRKLSMPKPPDESAGPEEPEKKTSGGKPDFSSQGTPIGDLPDLSAFGTPADEIVPLPEPRPAEAPGPDAINPLTAVKGATAGLVNSTGGIVQGLGTVAATGLGRQAPEGNEFAANPVPTDAAGNIATAGEAVAASPVVSAGKAIKSVAPALTPEESNTVLGKVSQMGGAIAPYALMTAINPLAGMGAGAVGMAADTYGNVYEQAKKAGADDNTASSAASKSALVAGVLGSLPLGAGKYAQGLVAKAATSSAAFAGAGEAQEWLLQQIAKDYDPKAGYTLDQKRLIAELILGAGMGGLHHAAEGRPGEAAPAEQPQPAAAGPQARAPGEDIPPPEPDFSDVGADAGQASPSAGTGSWQRRQPTPGDAGPKAGPEAEPPPTGSGPQPGPETGGPGAGNADPGGQQRQQEAPKAEAEPSNPPSGSGQGKTQDFTMDARTRAKMEKVMRTFEPTVDVSRMSDADLFNTLNDQLRNTSSTGYTAKPETPEEAAARSEAATARAERDGLIRKGWNPAWVDAMTSEQRRQKFQEAMAGSTEQPKAPEPPPTAAGTREEPIRPATANDVVKARAAEPTPAQALASNYRHATWTSRSLVSLDGAISRSRPASAKLGAGLDLTASLGKSRSIMPPMDALKA